MKTLSFREAGIDCDYVMEGKTDDEVIQKAKEHGAKSHGISEISGDMERQLRGRIKSV
jgi:predicted small metal-binding protein